mgnify:CR=1 FL=1
MTGEALTRFDIDAYGQRAYRDSGAFVQADDATREIAKRDILIRNLRNALVSLEKEARQMCESSYGDDDD